MKRIIKVFICLFVTGIITAFALNYLVVAYSARKIVNNYDNIKDVDCIIVLGAGVRDNKPSPMLQDRLDKAIELYNEGIADKIIVSGDHGRKEYDEVNIMKKYLIDHSIPSSNIFMDHAGFSTYDSMYRAKNIFNVSSAVVVTQEYHLYRSLYIASSLDLDVVGVSAEKTKYVGRYYRELREVIARDKDFFKLIFKPESTYTGEVIPVSGNGDITND